MEHLAHQVVPAGEDMVRGPWLAGLARQELEDVLHVDHADGVVEGLPVDGHAAVLGFDETLGELGEGAGAVDGHDVGAGLHDVIDPEVLEGAGLADQLSRGGCRRLRGLVLGRAWTAAEPVEQGEHAPGLG